MQVGACDGQVINVDCGADYIIDIVTVEHTVINLASTESGATNVQKQAQVCGQHSRQLRDTSAQLATVTSVQLEPEATKARHKQLERTGTDENNAIGRKFGSSASDAAAKLHQQSIIVDKQRGSRVGRSATDAWHKQQQSATENKVAEHEKDDLKTTIHSNQNRSDTNISTKTDNDDKDDDDDDEYDCDYDEYVAQNAHNEADNHAMNASNRVKDSSSRYSDQSDSKKTFDFQTLQNSSASVELMQQKLASSIDIKNYVYRQCQTKSACVINLSQQLFEQNQLINHVRNIEQQTIHNSQTTKRSLQPEKAQKITFEDASSQSGLNANQRRPKVKRQANKIVQFIAQNDSFNQNGNYQDAKQTKPVTNSSKLITIDQNNNYYKSNKDRSTDQTNNNHNSKNALSNNELKENIPNTTTNAIAQYNTQATQKSSIINKTNYFHLNKKHINHKQSQSMKQASAQTAAIHVDSNITDKASTRPKATITIVNTKYADELVYTESIPLIYSSNSQKSNSLERKKRNSNNNLDDAHNSKRPNGSLAPQQQQDANATAATTSMDAKIPTAESQKQNPTKRKCSKKARNSNNKLHKIETKRQLVEIVYVCRVPKYRKRTVCNDQQLDLSCAHNSQRLLVLSANYGTFASDSKNNDRCASDRADSLQGISSSAPLTSSVSTQVASLSSLALTGSRTFPPTSIFSSGNTSVAQRMEQGQQDCESQVAFPLLANVCHMKNICTFVVDPKLFNPIKNCPATLPKYLKLIYICMNSSYLNDIALNFKPKQLPSIDIPPLDVKRISDGLENNSGLGEKRFNQSKILAHRFPVNQNSKPDIDVTSALSSSNSSALMSQAQYASKITVTDTVNDLPTSDQDKHDDTYLPAASTNENINDSLLAQSSTDNIQSDANLLESMGYIEAEPASKQNHGQSNYLWSLTKSYPQLASISVLMVAIFVVVSVLSALSVTLLIACMGKQKPNLDNGNKKTRNSFNSSSGSTSSSTERESSSSTAPITNNVFPEDQKSAYELGLPLDYPSQVKQDDPQYFKRPAVYGNSALSTSFCTIRRPNYNQFNLLPINTDAIFSTAMSVDDYCEGIDAQLVLDYNTAQAATQPQFSNAWCD